jgi:polyvinyl alcohol dehydrogenase (cytochrome)
MTLPRPLAATMAAALLSCAAEPTLPAAPPDTADDKPEPVAVAQAELSLPPGLDLLAPTWESAGHDAFNHQNNAIEWRIRASNVASLDVAWTFDETDTGYDLGALHGTPVVSEEGLYVGSNNGKFYALNLDGTLRWEYTTRPPNPLLGVLATPSPVGGQIPVLYGTPIVGGAVYAGDQRTVVFGDLDGNIYALDTKTGKERWVKEQLDAHPLGGIVGNSLTRAGKRVIIGFSAIEDAGLLLPSFGIDYQCCSHTGFVVSIDIATGELAWRYDTIKPSDVKPLPEAFLPFKLGPSGADIWAAPAFDPASNTVYFGTGQNYSPDGATGTSTGTSDAMIALDASTGKPRWITQVTKGDIWVAGIPSPDANGRFTDQDFGDAPKLYLLPNGRKVVAAGQKSGSFWVLDAKTGAVIRENKLLQQANQLGGLQNGGAYGRDKVFVHGLNGLDPTTDQGPFIGTVAALSPDGSSVKWRFEKPFTGLFIAPLALGRDVLYFISPVEEAAPGSDPFQFALYALNADTGAVLKRLPFPGRAVSGPVVSQGRVYIVTGNRAVEELGTDDKGRIIALAPKRN